MLARDESVDRFDNNVIAFDRSDEEFRSIEASLYQVLHRTTSNEPLRTVQQTKGQKGFKAWHAKVRRYDQRNKSGKKSACAALISNISEKDRAKDVKQFDDILRTFTNEMNKFEKRFGNIRDEEKMLAVKKLMPQNLLNYRCRGTTMSCSELIVALESIIIDKVAMAPTAAKSIPPNTENWLRKLYNYSMNNDKSTEDKHETNHINNKCNDMNTRKMHIT